MSESIDAILNERGSTYGPFPGHAAVTQKIKAILREYESELWSTLSDEQRNTYREALDMIAHKMGRLVNGDPRHLDSWVDIAGYAKLPVRFDAAMVGKSE